jgi:hypothetical protein
MPRGGKRPGAGLPKGYKFPSTLTKDAIRARVQARVSAQLDPLLDAQIANAQGIKYLVVRQKTTGKFLRVTEAMARLRSNREPGEDEEVIEVWEKDPSVQAFTDLMNRAADKPIEAVQVSGLEGGPIVLQWQST